MSDTGSASETASPSWERALSMAADIVGDMASPNGEPFVGHARATIAILEAIGADDTTRTAAALVEPATLLPGEAIEREFGEEVARLVEAMRHIRRLRAGRPAAGAPTGGQHETLRRMLLAMASDIRVVLLRLASRLQTLRYHALVRREPDPEVSRETLDILAPLANRIGLWQLKWELEDLSFRFLEPAEYRALASALEERRAEREAWIGTICSLLRATLGEAGIDAEVTGRPKHLYSIRNKMRLKAKPLEGISDLRGVRVIVETIEECYAVLDRVHAMWTPVAGEYDDYVARPKPNGYRSLHTVVVAADGRRLEVQIRTAEMHRFAEYGVASHWRYKERAGAAAGGERGSRSDQIFDDRIAWIRQLLAWQSEVGEALGGRATPQSLAQPQPGEPGDDADERIYVLTPQARVIELPRDATPVDFAYQVHTGLGHRCRGARVDGQMVPLNTALRNGQTVEILSARQSSDEGPSRDWLNPQLGYARSARTRTKVRQWFNAREHEHDVAAGRERLEKLLQREGRTSMSLDELARRLECADAQALFLAIARETISARQVEEALRRDPAPAQPAEPDLASVIAARRGQGARTASGDGVLVVGLDSLLTQLARCCRPIPPDEIAGFVTHGRGVSVHRADCATLARLAERSPERRIETAWGVPRSASSGAAAGRYPVDIEVKATDRTGLLRDIAETFARDRVNVIGVRTTTRRQEARMRFTVEVHDAGQLRTALAGIREVAGVTTARRG